MRLLLCILLIVAIPVIGQKRMSLGTEVMDYGTGIYDFEEADFEMAEFDSTDKFVGFRHIHYDGYTPAFLYDKKLKQKEYNSKQKLARILDAQDMINQKYDTVIIVHNYNYPYSTYIVMSSRDTIFVEDEWPNLISYPIEHYFTKDPGLPRSIGIIPRRVFIDAVAQFNEDDFKRLIECSEDKYKEGYVSVCRAIIDNGALVSRKIYVFPYHMSWRMCGREASNNSIGNSKGEKCTANDKRERLDNRE